MTKPTRITPAALRAAADRQRIGTPYRFGNTVCARTEHWDAVIVRRQQAAIDWRTRLADLMDADGVTELRASTVRIIERPSFRCRATTVTVYAYADGSVFLYRHGTQMYSPAHFRRIFDGYHYIREDAITDETVGAATA
jgi:hypothetical protein